MADSVEQKLINAIVARMQLILPANGYDTSIGTHVEDSRPEWGDPEHPIEAISVFEGTVTTEEWADEGFIVERTMPVAIRTFHQRRNTANEDAAYARKVMRDVHAAIAIDDRWIVDAVPLAVCTREKQHGIEYAQNTFEITGTVTEIEILYRGSRFNLEQ